MASDEDCLFCGIVAGTVPGEIVDSDEHTVAFMDINPATPGHALVVPRAHAVDLTDVPDADLERTILAARRLARRMDEVLEPDGFNILNSCRAAAWQSVFHFHVHVIPALRRRSAGAALGAGAGGGSEIAEVAGRLRGDG